MVAMVTKDGVCRGAFYEGYFRERIEYTQTPDQGRRRPAAHHGGKWQETTGHGEGTGLLGRHHPKPPPSMIRRRDTRGWRSSKESSRT
uniref:Predicted gene 8024 n=1 Tax=Mus musculus TaxID=10090 RepID=A0AA74KT74_MOUSE